MLLFTGNKKLWDFGRFLPPPDFQKDASLFTVIIIWQLFGRIFFSLLPRQVIRACRGIREGVCCPTCPAGQHDFVWFLATSITN